MKATAIGAVVLTFLGLAYLYVQSDIGLLGDEYTLSIASTDVLGNAVYGRSCLRSAYIDDVRNLNEPSNSAALFKFHPKVGREIECPSVTVIVDRKTAEAWLN